MENLVLYDWLSLTTKIHTVDEMKAILGLSDVAWEPTTGAHGYKKREYFGSISIHYDGEPNQGIWLEMSGQGCRSFESFGTGDYESLFRLVEKDPVNIHLTRLDVAYDDHIGLLNMDDICRQTLYQEYVSKSKEWEVVQSSKGQSVFIGSPTSEVRIRIYDKAKERGYTDDTHWIRIEIQMRNDRARCFTKYALPVGRTFAGVLVNYLRYVVPSETESNKSRWDMTESWKSVIEDAMALSIYEKPGTEYNLEQLHDHLCFRNGNAISTYIQLVGLGQFLDDIRNDKPENVNPKYSRLIAEVTENRKRRKSEIENALSKNAIHGSGAEINKKIGEKENEN